jgi:hypothetical protein
MFLFWFFWFSSFDIWPFAFSSPCRAQHGAKKCTTSYYSINRMSTVPTPTWGWDTHVNPYTVTWGRTHDRHSKQICHLLSTDSLQQTSYKKLFTTDFVQQTSYNKLPTRNFLQETSYDKLRTTNFLQQAYDNKLLTTDSFQQTSYNRLLTTFAGPLAPGMPDMRLGPNLDAPRNHNEEPTEGEPN